MDKNSKFEDTILLIEFQGVKYLLKRFHEAETKNMCFEAYQETDRGTTKIVNEGKTFSKLGSLPPSLMNPFVQSQLAHALLIMYFPEVKHGRLVDGTITLTLK